MGTHLVAVKRRLYSHAALERAERDFHTVKSQDILLARHVANSADAQDVAIDPNLQVFTTQTWELDADDDGRLRLEDVDSGLKAVSTGTILRIPKIPKQLA